MIAKRIMRQKEKSNMARLVRYIVDVSGGINPRDWKLTADYIIDNKVTDSQKVASVRITNCETNDPVLATHMITLVQEKNKRSQSDKTYHLVLSFPVGERPEQKTLHEIEDYFCKSIGYEHHQRISAIHQDTDNLHIHVAINKINPNTYHNIEPYFDKRILMKTCYEVEKKYGLLETYHGKIENVGDKQKNKLPISNGKDDGSLTAKQLTDFEYNTGITSLKNYVKKILKDNHITGWEQIHSLLAEHGLQIKKRGNGLTIGNAGLNIWIKASDCDRSLSLTALVKNFGNFITPGEGVKVKPNVELVLGKSSQAKEELYKIYYSQKVADNIKRQEIFKVFKSNRQAYYNKLEDWYKKQMYLLRHVPKLPRVIKRNTLKQEKVNRKKEFIELQNKEKQKLILNKFPSWRDWLHLQATSGNYQALDVLQSISTREKTLSNDLLTAAKADKAAKLIFKYLKPKILNNGNILYSVGDGGSVVDAGDKLHTQKVTTGSAFLALSLAAKKFEGQPLILNGTVEFKKEVARLAAIHNINVIFEDQTLNNLVQQNLGLKEENKQPQFNKSRMILKQWIEKRNQYEINKPHVEYNNEYGDFKYTGRRMIGHYKVLLLERNNKVYIKTVTEREYVQAKYWDKGDKISVSSKVIKRTPQILRSKGDHYDRSE